MSTKYKTFDTWRTLLFVLLLDENSGVPTSETDAYRRIADSIQLEHK